MPIKEKAYIYGYQFTTGIILDIDSQYSLRLKAVHVIF